MGMYTEFGYKATLKADVPNDIIHALAVIALSSEKSHLPESVRHATLFNLDSGGWSMMLQGCTNDKSWMSHEGGKTILHGSTNLKNYEKEIEHFIHWIYPYVEKWEDVYIKYEEYDKAHEVTQDELDVLAKLEPSEIDWLPAGEDSEDEHCSLCGK